MVFSDSEVCKDRMFIFVIQVVTSLKEDAQVYMILFNLEVETKVSIGDSPLSESFLKCFLRIYLVYHLRER